MKDYTTMHVIRSKRLNDEYSEVILKRKREIVYKPSDILSVKTASDEYVPFFIASGSQEPWVRVIYSDSDEALFQGELKVRARKELSSAFPGLSSDVNDPVFICASVETAIFLSYISTYPGVPTTVYTINPVPNQEWIDNYPGNINLASVNELRTKYTASDSNHYICMPSDLSQQAASILSELGVASDKILINKAQILHV